MKLRWSVCNGSSGHLTPSEKTTMKVSSQHRRNGETGHISESKEEAFFDSQANLDSDCEDFYSVNGEQTPSLSMSPAHQKKRLSDLFCESFDNRFSKVQVGSNLNSLEVVVKDEDDDSNNKPNCPEEASRSSTINAPSKLQRKKSAYSPQHCLPALIRSLSFSERKKKTSANHSTQNRSEY